MTKGKELQLLNEVDSVSTTNFQKHLDKLHSKNSENWKTELMTQNWGGDYELADVQSFQQAITARSYTGAAVALELKTRHNALKKIIDSA